MTLSTDNEIKPQRTGWFKGWRVVSQIKKKKKMTASKNAKTEVGMDRVWHRKGVRAGQATENGPRIVLRSLGFILSTLWMHLRFFKRRKILPHLWFRNITLKMVCIRVWKGDRVQEVEVKVSTAVAEVSLDWWSKT